MQLKRRKTHRRQLQKTLQMGLQTICSATTYAAAHAPQPRMLLHVIHSHVHRCTVFTHMLQNHLRCCVPIACAF